MELWLIKAMKCVFRRRLLVRSRSQYSVPSTQYTQLKCIFLIMNKEPRQNGLIGGSLAYFFCISREKIRADHSCWLGLRCNDDQKTAVIVAEPRQSTLGEKEGTDHWSFCVQYLDLPFCASMSRAASGVVRRVILLLI